MSAKTKAKPEANPPEEPGQGKVSFFPAWCKRCGNCVAFCPRQALAQDEWGHPFLKDPERCTACGLCEMLCPDFAISVGEAAPAVADTCPAPGKPGSPVSPNHSPERLAPVPSEE